MSKPIIVEQVNSKFENVDINGSTLTLTRGNGSSESVIISSVSDADTLDGKHASDFASTSHIHSQYLPLSAGNQNVVSGAININADTTYNSTNNCIVKGYGGSLALMGGNNSTAKAVVCATNETVDGHYRGGILQAWRDDYPDGGATYYAGAIGITGQNLNQRVTLRVNPQDGRSFVFHNTDQGETRGNHETNVIFLNNGATHLRKDDNTNFIRIHGGGDNENHVSGGNVTVYGANCSADTSRKGCVRLQYNDGTTTNAVLIGKDDTEIQKPLRFTNTASIDFNNGTSSTKLTGNPNGILTWSGSVISCTSFAGTATSAVSATTATSAPNYLPLAGGIANSMTGTLYVNTLVRNSDDNSSLRITGGTTNSAANVLLYGKDMTGSNGTFGNYAGAFGLYANNGTLSKVLVGNPDGTLKWNGQAIQTGSDENIKTNVDDIPEDVLQAWGDVKWYQYHFKESFVEKGEKARYHLGVIAQRIVSVFEKHNLDATKYGIVCYDGPDEEHPNGFWTVRYEEALAMEAAYQRYRADKLEEKINEIYQSLK